MSIHFLLSNLFATDRTQYKVNSSPEFNWFEFRNFYSFKLTSVPMQKSPVNLTIL